MAIDLTLDNLTVDDFEPLAASSPGGDFGYVVTPNLDHLLRLHEDPRFLETYQHAAYVMLDSRVLARILKLTRGISAKVCTGSDLTALLFERTIRPDDRIVMIGGSDAQAALLAQKYGLRDFRHYNPPMGFIKDSTAVDQTAQFIEQSSPFRFCFLAVGSPQQELLALRVKQRGKARGLAFCTGAALNFLTGAEKRAPRWMQKASLEWLYRLGSDPGRLARRYLVRGPRVFPLLGRTQIVLRERLSKP